VDGPDHRPGAPFRAQLTGDLALVVQRVVRVRRLATEDAEVDHAAAGPQEGVVLAVGGHAAAEDLAALVDREGPAPIPAERAEVGHDVRKSRRQSVPVEKAAADVAC
jgi:hypothetical protein